MILRYLTLILALLFVVSVSSCEQQGENEKVEMSKMDEVFAKTLKAHGGDLYETAEYELVFRDKSYTFRNDGSDYHYTATSQKGDSIIIDELVNGIISRKINGDLQELTEKQEKSYFESLNSVIYFATLPHKLKDEAVNKVYMGETKIKGKDYHVMKVSFNEEGGGTDHDDNFYYWLNKSSHLIDYLAYDYTDGDGGVRFREANNTRNIDGIVFQDYVNYKAELGTPLADLPGMLERGELKKLSEINTEKVKSLSQKE
jgi:hypothetical protein